MGLLRRDRLDPNDVFVPSKIPLEKSNVYATRARPEESLGRYVRRAQVPVVFGEFGVGKTTLVRRYFRDAEEDGRLVYLSSASGKSMNDVLQAVLEHLDYAIEVERTAKTSVSAGGGFDVLVARANAGGTTEDGKREELVVQSPTDERVLRLMSERKLVLVIDEMHKASEEFRVAIADMIKSVRGTNSDDPIVVLIGTTMDAEQLVRKDPGIDRFVKELPIPPLSDEEARFIVEDGFGRLEISIPAALVETVVRTAAGAPTIVQEVCLNMAEAVVGAGRAEVETGDYQDAVRTYLQDHGRRLASVYVKSIEQVGPRRYRKQILLAMASIPHDLVNLDEIRTRVCEQLRADVPSTALSGPLRELKSGANSILQDVDRQTGDRVYNLSAFRDPMMKSFIRFMAELEDQGLLPPDRMRELASSSE